VLTADLRASPRSKKVNRIGGCSFAIRFAQEFLSIRNEASRVVPILVSVSELRHSVSALFLVSKHESHQRISSNGSFALFRDRSSQLAWTNTRGRISDERIAEFLGAGAHPSKLAFPSSSVKSKYAFRAMGASAITPSKLGRKPKAVFACLQIFCCCCRRALSGVNDKFHFLLLLLLNDCHQNSEVATQDKRRASEDRSYFSCSRDRRTARSNSNSSLQQSQRSRCS
jgi:hypothetical protein